MPGLQSPSLSHILSVCLLLLSFCAAAGIALRAVAEAGGASQTVSTSDSGFRSKADASAPVEVTSPAADSGPLVGEDFPQEGEGLADDGTAEEDLDVVAEVPTFSGLSSLPIEQDWIARAQPEDGRLVVRGGKKKMLTLDPPLQRRMTELLKSYAVPYGAVAAIEPATGRLLALAEHSEENPGLRGLALKAVYPAASVFKVVTGAALLASGTQPSETACYHGGLRRLSEKLLADDSRRDSRCLTFTRAMGHSGNVIFAKLARRSLDTKSLRLWADRLGFNAQIAFSEPLDVSVAHVPDDDFGFANTAAGFGDVFLSPLHGALLAGAVGNKGVWRAPVLFEGETGKPRRVLEEGMAATLSDMLETTVTEGTARRAFHERGRYVLGSIRAAGKTGSLASRKPYRDFSWFIGWAPKEEPRIAVAAVIVNGAVWRVRAPYVAREALRTYLEPSKDSRKGRRPRSRLTEGAGSAINHAPFS